MQFSGLQSHLTGRPLDLPSSAKQLYARLRKQLLEASDTKLLADSPHDVLRHLQLLPEPPPQILDDLRERALHEHAFCILGGAKNQQRERDVPHFRRKDGAWFDFSIVVREHDGHLDLLAYDFEIRLPARLGAPFLRFDLNLPDHANEARDIRCHLHPGCDDVLVPAPMMTPSELLRLFLEGAQPSQDRGARRDLTEYEASWFEQTHGLSKRRLT